MKTMWLCGNPGCTHRASKRWHRVMADRIAETVGPRAVEVWRQAHPDPELVACDDCGRTDGSHDPEVEH